MSEEKTSNIMDYARENPGVVKRVGIVMVLLAIGAPSVWWFVTSAEEKAYILFTNGYYAYRNRMYSQAAGQLGQLLSFYPNSKFTPVGRYYAGLTHLQLGNTEEAVGQFRYFIEENPKHFLREKVYPLWMAAELNSGRADEAVGLADRFLAEFDKENPTRPEILYRKGVALVLLDRKAEAKACFEEAAGAATDGSIYGNFALQAKTGLTDRL